MVSSRFYRLYIVLYLSFLIAMVISGVIWDVIIASTSFQMPRTITSLLVLIFSYLSLSAKHRTTENVMQVSTFARNRFIWMSKLIKIHNNKRSAKVSTKTKLIIMNVVSLAIALIPMLILGAANLGGVSQAVCDKWFLIAGLGARHVMWFVALFVSRFTIFWNKKRYLELI